VTHGAHAPRLLAETFRGDLRYLMAGRALRSVTQGYLAIVVPLFLIQLGYNSVHVGALLTVAAGTGALLTALVGFAADRYGRKPLLVVLGLLTAGGAAVFALSSSYPLLVVAGALGTIGRGGGAASGGAFGPYYPAEQALIAEHSRDAARTTVFAGLSLVGVLAAALGSTFAALPRLLAATAIGTRMDGFRAVFWLTALLGLAMAVVVLPIRERPPAAEPDAARHTPPLSPATRGLLARFAVTNAVNGLAVGFLGPILSLWFHLRYGVGAAEIGVLYFAINLAAIIPYLGVPWITRRLGGAVRTVVAVRLISGSMLAVIPLMPTFVLAGAIYLVRMLVNAVSVPVRQSYVMGIVPGPERSRMAALSNLPARVFAMLGPVTAGVMLRTMWLGVPLELASGLQLGYAWLYWRFFRNVRPPEEYGTAEAGGGQHRRTDYGRSARVGQQPSRRTRQ
jgi:MFS family permease